MTNMLTVCLLLALCNIHGLESKSIDFILVFPQAYLDMDIWMELSTGILMGLTKRTLCGIVLFKLNTF